MVQKTINISKQFIFMPRLGGAYCFRRVRSQRKSVDWGTMGPALGGPYECYAHISSFHSCEAKHYHIAVNTLSCSRIIIITFSLFLCVLFRTQ